MSIVKLTVETNIVPSTRIQVLDFLMHHAHLARLKATVNVASLLMVSLYLVRRRNVVSVRAPYAMRHMPRLTSRQPIEEELVRLPVRIRITFHRPLKLFYYLDFLLISAMIGKI